MDTRMIGEELESVENFDNKEIPDFAVAETENFAPSIEVQAAEFRDIFMDMPQLQFENWEKLDMEERIEALQQLENQVAEISLRPALLVESQSLSSNVYGFYDGSRIVISENLLSTDSEEAYKEVLNTLIHEGRHAYQDYNLYSGTVVEANQELVNAWRVNLDVLGYESGESFFFPEIGMAQYYTQPVEVDARAYADVMMRAIDI